MMMIMLELVHIMLLGKETGFPSESIVNAFNQRSQTSQLSILQIFHFLTTYCGMMHLSFLLHYTRDWKTKQTEVFKKTAVSQMATWGCL